MKNLKSELLKKYNTYKPTIKDPLHLLELTAGENKIENNSRAIELAEEVFFHNLRRRNKNE